MGSHWNHRFAIQLTGTGNARAIQLPDGSQRRFTRSATTAPWIAVAFVVSVTLNMLVLERIGSLVNYMFLYGLSGHFSVNGGLTLFAGCIGIGGFVSAHTLHGSLSSTAVVRRHLTVVSIYMNGIALFAMLAMVVLPIVQFR